MIQPYWKNKINKIGLCCKYNRLWYLRIKSNPTSLRKYNVDNQNGSYRGQSDGFK